MSRVGTSQSVAFIVTDTVEPEAGCVKFAVVVDGMLIGPPTLAAEFSEKIAALPERSRVDVLMDRSFIHCASSRRRRRVRVRWLLRRWPLLGWTSRGSRSA